jgi:hypothetical protein
MAGSAAETGVVPCRVQNWRWEYWGGSVSSGSAPTTSALVAFKNYQRDQVAARTAFAEREDVVRKIDSFKPAFPE